MPPEPVRLAAQLSVYDQFRESVRRHPDKPSLVDKQRRFTYAQTLSRVDALAAHFKATGLKSGDRIAVLAENCIEYIEIHLAAGSLGAVVACQNWRLQPRELAHCFNLVSPSLLCFSSRFEEAARQLLANGSTPALCLQDGYESALSDQESVLNVQETALSDGKKALSDVSPTDPETGLLILYTSGTTGPAKAALISHRALTARMTLLRTDLDVTAEDGFVAWSPMFHMGGSEHSLSTLMMGGAVFVADGFDVEYIVELIATKKLGWLLLVPATIDPLLAALDKAGANALGIKRVGAMADLLPKKQIQQISQRLQAPFLNSFGATETGIAPASRGVIAVGEAPSRLSKSLNSLCALTLVDEQGLAVAQGAVGEAAVKGPTLFSGYWGDEAANAKCFLNGWFRMGDLFRKNQDGTIDFCGRAKYLIKSGGENIYPAEIEELLLADRRIKDAIVVAAQDDKWGEVPVAVVAAEETDETALQSDLLAICRSELAHYKCPKQILLIDFGELPRSSSGKIVRNELQEWLRSSGRLKR